MHRNEIMNFDTIVLHNLSKLDLSTLRKEFCSKPKIHIKLFLP